MPSLPNSGVHGLTCRSARTSAKASSTQLNAFNVSSELKRGADTITLAGDFPTRMSAQPILPAMVSCVSDNATSPSGNAARENGYRTGEAQKAESTND